MKILVSTLSSLICVLPLITHAETTASDSDFAIEVTPFLGYRGGGEFDANDGSTPNMGSAESFGLVVGILTEQDTSYELLYSSQERTSKVLTTWMCERSICT